MSSARLRPCEGHRDRRSRRQEPRARRPRTPSAAETMPSLRSSVCSRWWRLTRPARAQVEEARLLSARAVRAECRVASAGRAGRHPLSGGDRAGRPDTIDGPCRRRAPAAQEGPWPRPTWVGGGTAPTAASAGGGGPPRLPEARPVLPPVPQAQAIGPGRRPGPGPLRPSTPHSVGRGPATTGGGIRVGRGPCGVDRPRWLTRLGGRSARSDTRHHGVLQPRGPPGRWLDRCIGRPGVLAGRAQGRGSRPRPAGPEVPRGTPGSTFRGVPPSPTAGAPPGEERSGPGRGSRTGWGAAGRRPLTHRSWAATAPGMSPTGRDDARTVGASGGTTQGSAPGVTRPRPATHRPDEGSCAGDRPRGPGHAEDRRRMRGAGRAGGAGRGGPTS